MSQGIDICNKKLYNETKLNKSNIYITNVTERKEEYEHNSKNEPHF